VLLELKTKSDCVENLLDLDPNERIVVSWSMNPERVVAADEHFTASLDERVAAARRCQEAGYKLGFHFDPIIEYRGWEEDYRAMIEKIFAAVDFRRVAWLSMGVLRQTPALRRAMRERFPKTLLLTGEQVFCSDGKFRYFQPMRVAMYRKMVQWIRQLAPLPPVYLCMESREVWEQVFGFVPGCEKELGASLTLS
jgi:spore photoproduct lyase